VSALPTGASFLIMHTRPKWPSIPQLKQSLPCAGQASRKWILAPIVPHHGHLSWAEAFFRWSFSGAYIPFTNASPFFFPHIRP
jgi:hypothetical protein